MNKTLLRSIGDIVFWWFGYIHKDDIPSPQIPTADYLWRTRAEREECSPYGQKERIKVAKSQLELLKPFCKRLEAIAKGKA